MRNGFVCFPPLFDIKLVPKQGEGPWRHSTWRGGNFLSGIQVQCTLKSPWTNQWWRAGWLTSLRFHVCPRIWRFPVKTNSGRKSIVAMERFIWNAAAVNGLWILNSAFSPLGLNVLTQLCYETQLCLFLSLIVSSFNWEMVKDICMLSFKEEATDLPLRVPSGSLNRCTFNCVQTFIL